MNLSTPSASRPDEFEIDLFQLFYILWNNVVWILLAAVLCADIGYGIATFVKTPIYTASADMLVNNRQNTTSGDTSTVTSSDLNASSSLVSTDSIILKSHTVLEEVINTLGLSPLRLQLSSTKQKSVPLRLSISPGPAAARFHLTRNGIFSPSRLPGLY